MSNVTSAPNPAAPSFPQWQDAAGNRLIHADCLPALITLPDSSVNLIYIDPPFNTGKVQVKETKRAAASSAQTRKTSGFGGREYHLETTNTLGYVDRFDDYMGFLRPRLVEAHRLLAANGSLFFHIDWRESAHCRLLLDEIFGSSAHCINEIIWAYDYGGRTKKQWAPKHDTIFWYAKNPRDYVFNYAAIDRVPYMAPSLQTPERAKRGKVPTDTWWHTIVPTNGNEKTGYATQKPLGVLRRIVAVHSNADELVLDFFAGSGTTGEAAQEVGRRYLLVDKSMAAVATCVKRLGLTQDTSLA